MRHINKSNREIKSDSAVTRSKPERVSAMKLVLKSRLVAKSVGVLAGRSPSGLLRGLLRGLPGKSMAKSVALRKSFSRWISLFSLLKQLTNLPFARTKFARTKFARVLYLGIQSFRDFPVTNRLNFVAMDERGDVPGWVLVVLMTTGLVTGIWTLAAPEIEQILRTSLSSMNGIR